MPPLPRSTRPSVADIVLFLVIALAFFWIIGPPILHDDHREEAFAASCPSNVKQATLGLTMYAEDFDGGLPPAARWREASLQFHHNSAIYHCPALCASEPPSYAMNRTLGSARLTSIESPEKVVMTFDSTPGPIESGGKELLAMPPRHWGTLDMLAFAEGHAKAIHPEKADSLIWTATTRNEPGHLSAGN